MVISSVNNQPKEITMARKKRTSPAAEKAATRAAALSSISPTLDLGNGLTLAAYNAAIAKINTPTTGQLAVYNASLSSLDAQLNNLQASETSLNTMSESMLAGVGVKYGKDSNEYEEAGGTRKSERAAPTPAPDPSTKPAKAA
jgi:hypothetical protein